VFPHLGIDAAVVRRAEGIDGTYNVCNFATKSAEVVVRNVMNTTWRAYLESQGYTYQVLEKLGEVAGKRALWEGAWVKDVLL